MDGDELPTTLKTTASIQDWCGHVWLQTNRRGGRLEVVGHSYFEAEGDERFELPVALLEDEVLAQIRLGARRLPLGEIEVIPSAFRARLDHRRLGPQAATATMVDLPRSPTDDVAQREYRLTFPPPPQARPGRSGARTLAVRFTKGFPFHITRIEETEGEGEDAVLLSRAVLTKTMRVAYWERNGTDDAPLRAELGLPPGK
jgi:hypothetical protein